MDKQVEEMTIALTEAQHEFDKAWHECLHNNGKMPRRENVFYAEYLIEKKGYRKQSEGAWIVTNKNGYWYYDCPFCDDGYAQEAKLPISNYCSNCGARLTDTEEEELDEQVY